MDRLQRNWFLVLGSLIVVEIQLKVVFDSDINYSFDRYLPLTKKKKKYIDSFSYHVRLLILKILLIYTIPFNELCLFLQEKKCTESLQILFFTIIHSYLMSRTEKL